MRQTFSFLFSLVFFLLCASIAQADDKDIDWYKIDRIGIPYTTDNPNLLGKNIWRGYDQAEAISALNKLPNYLVEDAYRRIIRALLISEAKAKKENLKTPALLTKRLNLLMQYGLFEDAKALYGAIPSEFNKQADPDLALVGLKLNLRDNGLSSFCLDLRALDTGKQSLAIQELKLFCNTYFIEEIDQTIAEFQLFPGLRNVLDNQPFANNHEKKLVERLIAQANRKESPQIYNARAKDLNALDDLMIKFALDKAYADYEAYQCYAIAAAERGLIDSTALKQYYKSHSFIKKELTSDIGDTLKTLNHCKQPAFAYQKLLNAAEDADKEKSRITNLILEETMEMPASALVPLSQYIERYAKKSKRVIWRAGIILALSNIDLDLFSPTEINMPIHAIQNKNQINFDEYKNWYFSPQNTDLMETMQLDPVAPLCFSTINSLEKINIMNICRDSEYEKLFFLTYAKKSINLGMNFDVFVDSLYDRRNMVRLLIELISAVGKYPINDISVKDAAVILSAFKASKLDKETEILIYKYLQ